jgi:hypothetical protein
MNEHCHVVLGHGIQHPPSITFISVDGNKLTTFVNGFRGDKIDTREKEQEQVVFVFDQHGMKTNGKELCCIPH